MKKTRLPETAVIVPFRELSNEALNGVIEQFISRDGPDSGHVDLSFDQKKKRVIRQLETGNALLIYDNKTCSCNIVLYEEVQYTV